MLCAFLFFGGVVTIAVCIQTWLEHTDVFARYSAQTNVTDAVFWGHLEKQEPNEMEKRGAGWNREVRVFPGE